MTEQEYNERVQQCTRPEDLMELSKQLYESQGLIERVHIGQGGERVVVGASARSAAPPISAPPDAPAKCFRVIYPKGNTRLEIQAASEQELDLLEANIRASYQR